MIQLFEKSVADQGPWGLYPGFFENLHFKEPKYYRNNEMNVCLYARTGKIRNRLLQIVDMQGFDEPIEIHRTIRSLSQSLLNPEKNTEVTVLAAGNGKELAEILNIGDQLQEIPLILILPDNGSDTVSKGHSLYPRFISYADDDFKDVAAVLNRMDRHKKFKQEEQGNE